MDMIDDARIFRCNVAVPLLSPSSRAPSPRLPRFAWEVRIQLTAGTAEAAGPVTIASTMLRLGFRSLVRWLGWVGWVGWGVGGVGWVGWVGVGVCGVFGFCGGYPF